MSGTITKKRSQAERNARFRKMRRIRGITSAGIVSVGLTLMLLASAPAQAQNSGSSRKQDSSQSDSLFAGTEKFAEGAIKSTEVNLDKSMLEMAGKSSDSKGRGTKAALASELDGVFVREYEYAKPGQYKMADVQKYLDRLDGNGWRHMVRERSADESTDICFRGGDDGEPSEMVIISAQPDQLSFVHLKGHMSMSDLSSLSHNFGPPQLKARPH